jgi:hypothetical protein
MMAAEITSETSVNFYQTIRRNIQEDSHLHTLHREKLKSHRKQTSMLIFKCCFTAVYFDEMWCFQGHKIENNPFVKQ